MKKPNFSKYIMCFFCVIFLLVGLYLSINNENIGKTLAQSIKKDIYATNSDETDNKENKDDKKKTDKKDVNSSKDTKTKDESSTKTNKGEQTTDMVQLLARLINGEARGESYEGQVAVGAVVLNRVKSPKFPNTITGVIYQSGQFSCIKDGQFDKPISKDATVHKAAKEAMNGADPSNGALYFYNPKTAKSKWLFTLKTVTTIGSHRFALEGEK